MASRRPAERPTTLARPLASGKVIPASTFAFLFSELISYHRGRTGSIAELETRLEAAGYGVGYRFLELSAFRSGKRDLDTVSALKFVSGTLWTQLFGRQADSLDVAKSSDAGAGGRNECEAQYVSLAAVLERERLRLTGWPCPCQPHVFADRIWDNVPITNLFISLPKEYSRFNPASFVAGVIHGALEGAGFVSGVGGRLAVRPVPHLRTCCPVFFYRVAPLRP